MPSDFRVYIDESGDVGFVTKADGSGSSRWFVLSAVVVRTTKDQELIKCLAACRALLGKQPLTPIHFRDLKHGAKKAYVTELAKVPVKLISVMAHKFANPVNPFTQKDQFYRYMIRLLLERVSWLCRDNCAGSPNNGAADIIFSNRASMSYSDVTAYLALLKTKNENEVKIHWPVIEPTNISTQIHAQLAGLQAVDAVASSTFNAVEKDKFGQIETAYLLLLKNRFYRHTNMAGQTLLWNYGLKPWPNDLSKTIAANPYLNGLAAIN